MSINNKVGIAVLVAILFLPVIFAACSKPFNPNPVNSPPPPPADTGVSFSKQVQPIFDANCAVTGCHAGSSPQDGMSLVAGKSYANLVNVPSIEVSNYDRVKPFYPDSSYLYFKITGNPIAGPRMPFLRPPLPDSLIQTIRSWILEGAKDN